MMKFSIESNSASACPLGQREMEKLAMTAVRKAGFLLTKKKLTISLACVSPSAIRKINKRYRRKDSATDVLSFGEYSDPKGLKKEKKTDIFLGELIVCCSVIKKSAKLNKVSYRQEFAYIFVHGVLHLLGLDHGEKMFSIQDEVVKKTK